jgi:hypothetical protein
MIICPSQVTYSPDKTGKISIELLSSDFRLSSRLCADTRLLAKQPSKMSIIFAFLKTTIKNNYLKWE